MNSYYDKPLTWNGHSINVKSAIIVDWIGPTSFKDARWRAKVKDSNARARAATVTQSKGPIEAAKKLLEKYDLDWTIEHGASTNNGNTYIFTIK